MGPRLHAIRDSDREEGEGGKLFSTSGDELAEHLFAICAVLGKLPEPRWSETWVGQRGCFEDDADESGLVVPASSGISTEGPLYELNKHH